MVHPKVTQEWQLVVESFEGDLFILESINQGGTSWTTGSSQPKHQEIMDPNRLARGGGDATGNMTWCAQHKPLLRQCQELLGKQNQIAKLSHYYRETNQIADKLANLAVNRDVGFYYLHTPPMELMDVLHADIVGASWQRMIKV